MSDGLSIPFALITGLSAAVADKTIIITTGLAAAAAGALTMGLGAYFTNRSEAKHQSADIKETKAFLSDLGLSTEMQEMAEDEIIKEQEKWAGLIPTPALNRSVNSGINTGIAYMASGLIPLCPYIVADHIHTALKVSIIITSISLFIFGYLRAKLTGGNPWAGAIRVILIAGLATAGSFGVAKIITG